MADESMTKQRLKSSENRQTNCQTRAYLHLLCKESEMNKDKESRMQESLIVWFEDRFVTFEVCQ